MENAKKFYVIDGNSLLFRAYYATAYGDNPSIMIHAVDLPVKLTVEGGFGATWYDAK